MVTTNLISQAVSRRAVTVEYSVRYRPAHFSFKVNELALGGVLSLYVPKLSPVKVIYTDFMYHRRHIILAIDSLLLFIISFVFKNYRVMGCDIVHADTNLSKFGVVFHIHPES